jgi:hypothetical protein
MFQSEILFILCFSLLNFKNKKRKLLKNKRREKTSVNHNSTNKIILILVSINLFLKRLPQ